MDFSSFNLQDSENLFKQNYQLNNNNSTNSNHSNHNNTNSNNVDSSNDFFNFMEGSTSGFDHGSNNMKGHHSSYTVPQLSPDGHEGSFTNSSVLSGHNPEFNMSPLQIASQPAPHSMMQSYSTPLQQSTQPHSIEDFADEEVLMKPS